VDHVIKLLLINIILTFLAFVSKSGLDVSKDGIFTKGKILTIVINKKET